MNILITGSQGYVASNIVSLCPGYNFTCLNRDVVDLRDAYSVKKWFDNKYFDVVIHTAIKGGSRLSIDNSIILDENIKLYLNLIDCKEHYKKFINIGSGAAVHNPNSFYGLSKRVINASIQDKENFYNLVIYGIFNDQELDSRFIKNCINRYINHANLIIFKNKLMDFMYMNDFIKILQQYICHNNLPKSIDCVYDTKYSLLDIANIINDLDTYRVPIDVLDTTKDKDYIGQYTNLNINFAGLKTGILNTYRKICYEKNLVCAQ